MNAKQESSNLYQEINFKGLVIHLWKIKTRILLTIFILSFLALFYALSLADIYKSESALIVQHRTQSPFLAVDIESAFSNVQQNHGKRREIIAFIKSREFFRHLLNFEDVLPSIVAAEGFDSSSGAVIFDTDLYKEGAWVRKPPKYKTIVPSYLEAHKIYIEDLLEIEIVSKAEFIKIGIEHVSPVFAKRFLDLIISEADNLLREEDISQSSRALDYLNQEISKNPRKEVRDSINSIIEKQLEIKMFAEISDDYLLKKIDHPLIPEEKIRPYRVAIVITGLFVSSLLTILFFTIRYVVFIRD